MKTIPLTAAPSQTLSVVLAGQSCQIKVYQLSPESSPPLYMDLSVAGASIVRTRIARDRGRVLLDAGYQGFIGDFIWIDTQGTSDPRYAGLGTRWQLIYLESGVDI